MLCALQSTKYMLVSCADISYAVTMPPKKFVGTIRRFAKPPTDVTYRKTSDSSRVPYTSRVPDTGRGFK